MFSHCRRSGWRGDWCAISLDVFGGNVIVIKTRIFLSEYVQCFKVLCWRMVNNCLAVCSSRSSQLCSIEKIFNDVHNHFSTREILYKYILIMKSIQAIFRLQFWYCQNIDSTGKSDRDNICNHHKKFCFIPSFNETNCWSPDIALGPDLTCLLVCDHSVILSVLMASIKLVWWWVYEWWLVVHWRTTCWYSRTIPNMFCEACNYFSRLMLQSLLIKNDWLRSFSHVVYISRIIKIV